MTTETQVQETKKDEKSKTLTLGELGNQLPIYSGNEKRNFSFKDWDMETEEVLSDLQEKSKNVGEFVREMMSLLLDEYEGQDWDARSKEEKVLLLSKVHFPNMMYMYIALRVEELGHELMFDNITCPTCRKNIENFCADLRKLEIICKDKDHKQDFELELKKPIRLDEKTITGLKIGVTSWGALESVPVENASNSAVVKKALFKSSIQGALTNGEPTKGFVDLQTLIKKLKKIDIERVNKALLENNGGPNMILGGNCPFCKTEFVKGIEWRYDVFFDSSSLS